MGMMTQAQLRPLTETEQRAVGLMDAGADIEDAAAQTRLSRAQIVAARDLASLWNAVKRDTAAAAPTAPVGVEAVPQPALGVVAEPDDTRPVITIEVEPIGTEPTYDDDLQPGGEAEPSEPAEGRQEPAPPPPVAVGDIAALLERGRASGNLRARDLAFAVDRRVAELAEILETDERTRAVREEIARLEEALAAKRRELDGLLPVVHAKPAGDVPPRAVPPRTVTVGGVQVDRRLYYSEAVRSWARENGREVAATGKMPREVVEAYVAAFPAEVVAA